MDHFWDEPELRPRSGPRQTGDGVPPPDYAFFLGLRWGTSSLRLGDREIAAAAAEFDPAFMAAMDRPWRDIVFSQPEVLASGMTPPDHLPT